jgi:Xaa-Pro dipeptidase
LDEALAGDLGPYLNATVLQSYRGFGGVRLEDVVTITQSGFINYTLCPRTVHEVESVMAGGKWPPLHDDAPELGRERLTDPNPLPSPPRL